ncbi:pyruvate dehydrogenase complex dihydrolipoyllysine-residue acetyltransferase [Alteromonas sp. LMIT006]|jgi:pyruvate dehydrogenase E2 component (dihydrolipoamide acetyltransferase)|uniref:pyruvate dehydrogenase complex dihydrolipoyllysine-residue acetyltransferase n=1 Tax=Alteromonadaceae TaxID=72275 RepID=UPI0020CA94C5|nr:pyruvate dehydrogenase complex dihydrolipoyllysine-residue acetyltransferase [Alteromonas sp. LMIT006]UTP73750.1 pyruvate dehydrogenase complex dihydrolipoyllysine-residue acetyltransferase [Alteromonas sp. LMIT006]
MSDMKDVFVPDLGEDSVEVIEICVSVGDSIDAEDAIVTVESDKASMDIPAPFGGSVSEICVAVGDKISEGTLLAKIASADSGDATATEAPVASEAPAVETVQAEAPSGESIIQVTVPDIGGDENVDVIEVLVAVGDSVDAEDGLITLETDKASMDVPCPEAGVVKAIHAAVGDKVSEGSLVIDLAVSTGATDSATAAQPHVTAEPLAQPAPAVVATSAAQSTIQVTVPDIGGDENVDVIDVLVAVGDKVEAEDGLITLETDKASMDVPCPEVGIVKAIHTSVGDKVSQGSLVIDLEVAGAPVVDTPAAPAPAPQATAPATAPVVSKAPPVPHHPSAGEIKRTGRVHASPSVRRLAREFGVDLTQVTGSGNKGRIVKEDVQSYVKYELSRPKATAAPATGGGEGGLQVIAQPKVDFSKFGEVEELPLTRIQKLSGPNLHRNWVTIPHVTQFDEADITDLEDFRKQQNVVAEKRKLGFKITPLVFMMKAAADALKAYPTFNSSLSVDGESLILKKYFHIGIAVDTPNGLVVPVVRDVDQKGIYELSQELMEISIKAREGKLKAADMQGSCFTISSLGGIGGTAFTPIVNAPDVAILGVSKSEIKPKWNGKDFDPRLMLPLSLSYDHRVIDGALAARFTVHLKNALEDLRNILL